MKQGWEMKKFEELIQENQIGLIKSSKEQGNDKAVRYLKMDSITSDNNLVHNKYVYVDATSDELEKFTLNDGDFLFNTRNSYELVGKTCVFSPIDDEPTLFNNNIMRVVFKKGVSSKFINYAFSSEQVKKRLQKLKSGTTSVVGIYYNGLRNLEIPLPPLPEQQRIVSILDEVFAAITKAKANAEQNLKNARELFESYLQSVFEKKGDGWQEKTLEELADENCTLSYGIVQPGEEFENGLPVIRPTDLITRFVKIQGLKRIDPKLADGYQRTKLVGDELLLCVRGTTGVVSIATPELKNANVTRGIVPIRFNKKIVNQEFGYYLLISSYVQKQIQAKTYGAALMQINIGDLRKIKCPFPSLKEQQTIVRQLDALRAETQKLEVIYQKKIEDLEELKKSILQKAFSGELRTEKVL
ncbi:MAG: restriction endonuclease subunit S [Chitinophagaceae bacterium]|nr:restriction endonuclease subunit S [Chitinophagaceae bacterium]